MIIRYCVTVLDINCNCRNQCFETLSDAIKFYNEFKKNNNFKRIKLEIYQETKILEDINDLIK